MHPLIQYSVCSCLWDLHFEDGTFLPGVYLAKLPGSVKIIDINDDGILASVDHTEVQFER